MPTLKIHKENDGYLHFLSLTVIEWIDIFTKPEYFQILYNSLIYCIENKGLLVYEYVFMTNHIHLIISSDDKCSLSDIIRDFKKYTTKEILKELKKDRRKYILNLINNSFTRHKGNLNQIWQKDNYPEVIETDKFLNQKIDYIHNNPVVKEYVRVPEDWFYSSAGYRLKNLELNIKLEDY